MSSIATLLQKIATNITNKVGRINKTELGDVERDIVESLDALKADKTYVDETFEPLKGTDDNYVTDAEKTVIGNTSNTNSGDETTESILDKIGDGSKVSSDYLPSYVDDIVEVENYSELLETTGETGKIYLTLEEETIEDVVYHANSKYRWSGSVYVNIDSPMGYATESDAQTATNDTKIMTALKVVQSFIYQIANKTIESLQTTSKTVVGAINELKGLFSSYWSKTDNIIMGENMINMSRGSDIQSANVIALPTKGNTFRITGNTEIRMITMSENHVTGLMFCLLFNENIVLKHNYTDKYDNTYPIKFPDGVDFAGTAGQTIFLNFDANGQCLREVGRYFKSGTNIKTLFGQSLLGSGDITFQIPSKAWYVDVVNGDDTAGIISHWFKTIEAAVTQASSGDTVIVMPGTHAITTTATNGIGKEGIKYYFHAGAIVNKASNGDIFNTSGMTNGFDVFGHGVFNKTAGTGGVYNNLLTSRIFTFEGSEAYSSDYCFYCKNSHVKVPYAQAVGYVVWHGTNSLFQFKEFKSTNSTAVCGQYVANGIKLEGQKLSSSTGMAIAQLLIGADTAEINVTTITGVGDHVVDLYTEFETSKIVFNCTYATSVCNYVGTLTGSFITNKFTNSGICEANVVAASIVSLAGTMKATIKNETNGYNITNLTVSGGQVVVEQINTRAGLGFNITGGTVTIKQDIYTYTSPYPTTRLVNGGILILEYSSNVVPISDYFEGYGLNYSICKLQSGKVRLKGNIATGLLKSLIEWYGGNLIIDHSVLTSTQSNCIPIRATQPNLQLKVTGNYATNITSLGGVLAGKYYTEKFTVSAVATTSVGYNSGAPYPVASEADTVTYDTKAKLAQRMAELVTIAFATVGYAGTQDSAGVDEYFYIVGTSYGKTQPNYYAVANLVRLLINYESYPMTEVCGGVILENNNVE